MPVERTRRHTDLLIGKPVELPVTWRGAPGLTLFTNTEASNPGPLLAAAMLATLPVVAVYLIAARRITAACLHTGLR
jgi:ABC-type glycerol-3-phosphate transport system permease component